MKVSMLTKFLLVTLSCTLFTKVVISQKALTLINSGALLKQGNELHDKEKYKEAIAIYKQIDRSDTNYSSALYELSFSCFADSQLEASLEYAKIGLKQFPELFPKFCIQAGNALDDLGRQAEALKVYDEGLVKNPNSVLLSFNKAVTQFRMGNEADSKKTFQQTLLIDPYYASAHYFLGLLYLREGNFVPSMLAFKTYLLLAPSGKYLNKVVANLNGISKVTDDALAFVKTKKPSKEDNFDFLQQIVISKIALDKQYKLQTKLEDDIIRQLQVVDEKLEYKRNDNGFAMQFYVPIYSKLFKEGDFEPLVYSIFSGIGIKEVDGWLKKNNKEVEKLSAKLVAYFTEIRATKTLIEPDRKNVKQKYFYEGGQLIGKGDYSYNANKLILNGYWDFYNNENGLIKSKGSFGAPNDKEGEWLYYYDNGVLKEKTLYKNGLANGPSETFFSNGNKWYTVVYNEGKTNGLLTTYYYNGLLFKTTNYKNDKKDGVENEYNTSGYLAYKTIYANDEKEGMQTNYYDDGKVEAQLLYKKDKAQGTYKSFYKDGKINLQGEFVDDKRQGPWVTYHNNGKIKENYIYKDNEVIGEFTEFYEDGKIETKGTYAKKKLDGKVEYFNEDGKIYSDAVYDKGKLREINFYDPKGNPISSTSTRKGAADITFYNMDGIKSSQGFFNKDGNKDGDFTEYFTTGKISEKATFKDGMKQGNRTTYYGNGQKRLIENYINDLENGNTKSYYYNGKPYFDGWIIDDLKQQTILYHNQRGDLKTKNYYLNNELDGYQEFYYPGNIKDAENKYTNGWLDQIIQFDSTGKIIATNVFDKGKGPVVYKHYNGNIYGEGTYSNYNLNGVYKNYFFDKSPQSVGYYKNGERDSTYKSFYYGGKVQMQGKYKSGDKVGIWTYYYENGKISEEENYVDGKLEGVDKIYSIDGSLDKLINYKDNEFNGEYIFYGDKQQVALILNYKNGALKSYTYEDKTGAKVPAILLKGGSGKVTAFYKNGVPSADVTYVNSDAEGSRKFFFSTGKIYVDGSRNYGYDNGSKKTYYADGTLYKVENFELGNKHGLSQFYYPNGKLEKEINYYNDDYHGKTKYYDEQGKLKQTRNYYYDNLLTIQ